MIPDRLQGVQDHRFPKTPPSLPGGVFASSSKGHNLFRKPATLFGAMPYFFCG
jgi:hypothetical protein